MASPTDLAELNRLGPVLARLGLKRVNLSWSETIGYFVDGKDGEGRYFSGAGETPSAALAAADRAAAITASRGVYVDA